MNKSILLSAAAIISMSAAIPSVASASSWVTTSGSVWAGVLPTFDASIPDYVFDVSDTTFAALPTPSATFLPADPHDLNFSSPPSGGTIGGFLNNPVFVTGSGIAGDGLSTGLGHDAASTGTDIQIVGSVLIPHGLFTFDAIHDDGLFISIDGIGTVFSSLNEHFNSETIGGGFNPGATGFFAFHANYNECCGLPGMLQVSDPRAVPEPTTWALMLVGFGGLGVVLRNSRRRANAMA
jgi:hypothetical protein